MLLLIPANSFEGPNAKILVDYAFPPARDNTRSRAVYPQARLLCSWHVVLKPVILSFSTFPSAS